MDEPKRIGLTAITSTQLDDLLTELNPQKNEVGVSLIKFDIYRLAVALGIKSGGLAPPLKEKSNSSFRVSELDEDRVLYTAIENSDLKPADIPVYEYIERLAECGISNFYSTFQQTGELPLEEYFRK